MKKAVIFCVLGVLISFFAFSNSKTNIVENNNEFAFELFMKICETDTANVFISPLSISTALSMTYDGAKGKTAKEMRTVMRFSKDQSGSHSEFTDLLNYYRNSKQNLFKLANAAVAQERYTFLSSYFDLLKNYGAIIKTADFKDFDKREQARNNINKWVMDNTNGKIEELLDANSLNDLTRLVILNAIHFKADWQTEFPADQTRQMIFYGKNRQYISHFMHVRERFGYYQNEEVQVVELPYKDDLASMYIIFPAKETDIDQYSKSFTYDEFANLLSMVKKQQVDIQVPKFKLEAKYKLKDVLMSMGMVRAFTHQAQFNKMTGRSDLMIDEVIHQSFIEIDEVGTEAAAATAVVMREKSAPQPVYITLNRPFVFVIKEKMKGSVLFVGKFMNP